MSVPQITLRSLPDGGYVVAERAAFSTMAEAAAYFDKLLGRDRVHARVEEIAREHHRGTMAETAIAEGNGYCDGA